MTDYLLAIDQGTTSTRAILFDAALQPIASAQEEFPQIFPAPGWVEHDPEAIWQTVLSTVKAALHKAGVTAKNIASIGIANQRETTVIWDRASGKPVYNAIVWQDRRTSALCNQLRVAGHEKMVQEKTGLLLDPYFSATKISWILDHGSGARQKAERGELAFGTMDSFLLWRLTSGTSHKTDATNAARTMLYNIHKGAWDDDMLKLFNIPPGLLPAVHDCAADYGQTAPELFGAAISINGMAGDQQAATIGQACFHEGMMKATYGTGCFALLHCGATPVLSSHKLLTTIAYQFNGQRCYALEGSIFMAGATVQWLRDQLKIIAHAREADALAQQADAQEQVYLVPAFVGLGAPWWQADARASLFGLTRKSGAADICRAALEAVAYQTRDLLEAMRKDWPATSNMVLRVDGGMTASSFAMQFLADMLGAAVERPAIMETTAKGAAYCAGFYKGLVPAPERFAALWQCDQRFMPSMAGAVRAQKWQGWQRAVQATLHYSGT